MPAAIAATRSNTTVRTKVVTSTVMSLLGAVFMRCLNSLHSLILYATMKRIAAIVGIGISSASGIRNRRTSRRITACTIPTTGVLPPFLMLAAVLAIAPVAGIPPKQTDAMLPMPCATSSARL